MTNGKVLVASLLAALAASLCCILPIVFAIAGISVVGASAAFAAWRPWLLAITGALLAAGFYFAYRPAKAECAPGEACAATRGRRGQRVGLWIATALVAAVAAFPYYSAPVARALLPGSGAMQPQPTGKIVEAQLAIQGMDCQACAVAITHNLKATPGVVDAKVLYPAGRAVVRYRAGQVTVARLVHAVALAGYRSHPM